MTDAARPGPATRAGLLLQLAGVALIGLYLVSFVARNASLQWDLEAYLLAARTALGGLNPYRLEDMAVFAHRPVTHPFLYPPVALLPFVGLTALPAGLAATTWIVAKTLILAGLVLAWSRWFAPRVGVLAIALVAVFGWNASALHDLRAGNVALIECGLLWSAFACFTAGRRGAFAALVVTASLFKLMPAAYLLLLLVPTDRHGSEPRRFLIALAVLVALVALPFAIGPAAQWDGFLRHVPSAQALGDANPSAWALATALVERTGMVESRAQPVATGLWVAYGIALLVLSRSFLRDLWTQRDARRWVMAAVLLDLLLAPRPMAYGFARLGPAPLFFASEALPRPGWVLLLALILSAQGLARAAHHQIESTLVIFSPFLLTLGLWLLVTRKASREASAGSVSE